MCCSGLGQNLQSHRVKSDTNKEHYNKVSQGWGSWKGLIFLRNVHLMTLFFFVFYKSNHYSMQIMCKSHIVGEHLFDFTSGKKGLSNWISSINPEYIIIIDTWWHMVLHQCITGPDLWTPVFPQPLCWWILLRFPFVNKSGKNFFFLICTTITTTIAVCISNYTQCIPFQVSLVLPPVWYWLPS